jgi:hypothetical protein
MGPVFLLPEFLTVLSIFFLAFWVAAGRVAGLIGILI